ASPRRSHGVQLERLGSRPQHTADLEGMNFFGKQTNSVQKRPVGRTQVLNAQPLRPAQDPAVPRGELSVLRENDIAVRAADDDVPAHGITLTRFLMNQKKIELRLYTHPFLSSAR